MPDADIAERTAEAVAAPASETALTIHDSLAACEAAWREFEKVADHTVFQSFGWASAWMRHIGARRQATPAIVIGRNARDEILFVMPFAVERGGLVRRLTWLGSDNADYNAPLLSPGFASVMCERRFALLWKRIIAALRADRRFRPDALALEKMPDMVGAQRNPFTFLATLPNPSGAHVASLFGDWETYYFEKRSSSTRKNDRAKRKKLADLGEVRMVEPADAGDVRKTLDVLFQQKSRQFARMGVADIFARPGHAEFYADLATGPATRGFAHVSRLDVGATAAAANFGTIYGGRYYHLIAAYDDGEVARFGPGAAHLRELLRTAIERGCKDFDFTIGDEPYKREWSDRTIALHDLHQATSPAGWMVAASERALARAKRVIKQTPVLWQAFTRTRALRGRLSLGQPAAPAPAKAESEE